mgnify:CR=1 FL=1
MAHFTIRRTITALAAGPAHTCALGAGGASCWPASTGSGPILAPIRNDRT